MDYVHYFLYLHPTITVDYLWTLGHQIGILQYCESSVKCCVMYIQLQDWYVVYFFYNMKWYCCLRAIMKGTAPLLSVRSLVVDEERMRPSHWLVLVLCVPFSALTLMVRWQKGHLDSKRSCSTNPQRFCSRTDWGWEGEPADKGYV